MPASVKNAGYVGRSDFAEGRHGVVETVARVSLEAVRELADQRLHPIA